MTQKKSRPTVPSFTFGIFLLLVLTTFIAAPTGATVATSTVKKNAPLGDQIEATTETETVSEGEAVDEEPSDADSTGAPPQPGAQWMDYPNVCETFTVIEGTSRVKDKGGKMVYPLRYRRNRFDRKRSHQKRTKEIILLVAKEMGADEAGQHLVAMMAHHESSYNPEAIHILNRDLTANLEAWELHSYDRGREIQLEEKLKVTSAKTKKFWSIKAQLADLRLYKGNPFWDSELAFLHKIPERTLHGETTKAIEVTEHRSVWAFGYGLFGMNSVLFTHVWDREAPPWILCGDEGIVAVVTAIWALRAQQEDCAFLSGKNPEKYGTNGANAEGVIQRFARGHCSDKKLGKAWQRLMDDYGSHIAWTERPDFGDKFPKYEMRKRRGKWVFEYEKVIDPATGKPKLTAKGKPLYKRDSRGQKIKIPTDRQVVLAHMREKAEAEGLLRIVPLERKKPDSAPIVVATLGTAATAAP